MKGNISEKSGPQVHLDFKLHHIVNVVPEYESRGQGSISVGDPKLATLSPKPAFLHFPIMLENL